MAIKRKAFVIPTHQSGGQELKELNTLLDVGWAVKQVEQSSAGTGTSSFWFVVAEKVPGADGWKGHNSLAVTSRKSRYVMMPVSTLEAWNRLASTLPKRLIDLNETELKNIIVAVLAEMPIAAPTMPAELLSRTEAAKLLGISLSKLDLLCRRDTLPIPFRIVGAARRFFRSELLAWVQLQPSND
jgi:predicted DNA-binding transcriptional regulator AlpA